MGQKTRREYGSGSVSQRKDGTWTARMVIGVTPSGNPKIKALYGKTEREVKRKLKDFQKEFYKNDQVTTARESVERYMRRWLYSKKANELKQKSFDRLEQTVLYQVVPYIGNLQVQALRADDVQDLINRLKQDGLSWSTVKKAYDAINECFRTGVEKRDISFNPASGVSVPTQKMFDKQPVVKFYTGDEIAALVEAATKEYSNGVRHYRLGDLVPIGIHTGLRNAELLGLRWEDVDLDNRLLYVTQTRVLVKDRNKKTNRNYYVLEQDSGKTLASIRTVEINQAAYDAFVRLKKITGSFKYVLSTKDGKPVNPRFTDKTLRNIAIRAGFPEEKIYGMHSLRHTFATQLFAAGVDVKTVSVLLGHASTTITYNTYIHVINAARRNAVEKIS